MVTEPENVFGPTSRCVNTRLKAAGSRAIAIVSAAADDPPLRRSSCEWWEVEDQNGSEVAAASRRARHAEANFAEQTPF